MRVKVGNTWHECNPGQPIMVELTDADKRNIAGMAPSATRYAVFDDADQTTPAEKLDWMSEGGAA